MSLKKYNKWKVAYCERDWPTEIGSDGAAADFAQLGKPRHRPATGLRVCKVVRKWLRGCKLAAGEGVYLSDGSRHRIGIDEHGHGT